MPIENEMKGTIRGTQGYFPCGVNWGSGDIRWDIWSLGAMLMEFFIGSKHFYKASNSAPIIAQAKKMQTYSYVPESVKKIVRETVLAKKTMMMGLKNFEQQVRKIGEEDPSASI